MSTVKLPDLRRLQLDLPHWPWDWIQLFSNDREIWRIRQRNLFFSWLERSLRESSNHSSHDRKSHEDLILSPFILKTYHGLNESLFTKGKIKVTKVLDSRSHWNTWESVTLPTPSGTNMILTDDFGYPVSDTPGRVLSGLSYNPGPYINWLLLVIHFKWTFRDVNVHTEMERSSLILEFSRKKVRKVTNKIGILFQNFPSLPENHCYRSHSHWQNEFVKEKKKR